MANLSLNYSNFVGILSDTTNWTLVSVDPFPIVESGALRITGSNGLLGGRAYYLQPADLTGVESSFSAFIKILLDGSAQKVGYKESFGFAIHNDSTPNTNNGNLAGFADLTPSIIVRFEPYTNKIIVNRNGFGWMVMGEKVVTSIDIIGQLYVWIDLVRTTHILNVYISNTETKPATPELSLNLPTLLSASVANYFTNQVYFGIGSQGGFVGDGTGGSNEFRFQEFKLVTATSGDLPPFGGSVEIPEGTAAGLDEDGKRIPFPNGITKRVYFIGNSVTDELVYTDATYFDLDEIAEDAGYTHVWGRKMIPGAPLSFHLENMQNGFTEQPFGYPDNAFPNYIWDDVSFQPFDRSLESDRQSIATFLNLIKQNPDNLGNTRPWIYGWWCPLSRVRQVTGLTGSGTNGDLILPDDLDLLTPQHWRDTWRDGTWNTTTDSGNTHCRDFYQKLTLAVRADHPGLPPALMFPIGEAMNTLNEMIAAGQVPGYTSIFQLYADGVHLGDNGSYLVCLVVYACLYWQDPRNIPPGSLNVSNVDPVLLTPIQEAVHQTVFNSAYAGATLGTDTGKPNQKPTAVINASVTSGEAPLTVNFNTEGSTDPDAGDFIYGFDWDFGDGSPGSNGSVPSHTYTVPGTYPVTLRVQDQNLNFSDPVTLTITVLAPNQVPTAGFTLSSSLGEAPLTVSANASASFDPDGTIAAYEWDFGDGTILTTSTPIATHTYQNPGAYIVTLRVQDNDDAYSALVQKALAVTAPSPPPVVNQRPVAVITASVTSGIAPVTVNFSGLGSSDPDGTIAAYEWDLGDGATNTLASFSHTYQNPGAYLVKLRVQDDEGTVSDYAFVLINVSAAVVNPPPVTPPPAPTLDPDPVVMLTSDQRIKLIALLKAPSLRTLESYLNRAYKNWGYEFVFYKLSDLLDQIDELETRQFSFATNPQYGVVKTKNVEMNFSIVLANLKAQKHEVVKEIASFLGMPSPVGGYPGFTPVRKR